MIYDETKLNELNQKEEKDQMKTHNARRTTKRREVLKGLGIVAPTVWIAPIVSSVSLPSHAQTSHDAQTSSTVYVIGDTGPCGGIVFYISNGGLNGLEAAPSDQSTDIEWGCTGIDIAGATGTAIGTGATNTAAILAGCATRPIAASVADDFSLGGCNDWFLPSQEELNQLYLQKAVVGGLSTFYWSSSQIDTDGAWGQNFVDGNQGYYDKYELVVRSRAVRAF